MNHSLSTRKLSVKEYQQLKKKIENYRKFSISDDGAQNSPRDDGSISKDSKFGLNDSEDKELEKEIKKRSIPVFSTVSLRTFKRNLKAKIK